MSAEAYDRSLSRSMNKQRALYSRIARPMHCKNIVRYSELYTDDCCGPSGTAGHMAVCPSVLGYLLMTT